MDSSRFDKKTKALLLAHHPQIFSIMETCRHYGNENLSILSFSDSPDSVSPSFAHSHEEYEFLIPYGPLPMIMYEGNIYFGEVGFIYPVQSGKLHASKFNVSAIPHDNIVIDKAFLDSLFAEKGYADKEFDVRFNMTNEIASYLRFFKNEAAKGAACSEEKLHMLSTLLAHELISGEFAQSHTRPKHPQEYQKGIMQIASYMNQHFSEPISIEQLADMCKLSKPYFIAAFKKVIGETPYSYLVLLRIAKAKILLETSEYPVNKIAELCGFSKSNTFTSLFKSSTGMTPTQYRKQL